MLDKKSMSREEAEVPDNILLNQLPQLLSLLQNRLQKGPKMFSPNAQVNIVQLVARRCTVRVGMSEIPEAKLWMLR